MKEYEYEDIEPGYEKKIENLKKTNSDFIKITSRGEE